MKKGKKDSNLDEVFEEMTKKAEKGISLAEQIVDLKSDHEHNLKLMKGLNDKIADLEKVNNKLLDVISNYEVKVADLEQGNAELKEELKNWKDEWQEQVQKATDEGYARTQQTIQLTKAKELLKGWLGDFYNSKAFHQQIAELVEQSEQFLKEIEK